MTQRFILEAVSAETHAPVEFLQKHLDRYPVARQIADDPEKMHAHLTKVGKEFILFSERLTLAHINKRGRREDLSGHQKMLNHLLNAEMEKVQGHLELQRSRLHLNILTKIILAIILALGLIVIGSWLQS